MSLTDHNREESGSDTALFDALYRDHHRPLYAYLHGQAGCAETAADLLQETFVRVWKHIAEAQRVPCDRQRFWLFALARSAACDHRRRRAVRQHLEAVLLPVETVQTDAASDPAVIVAAKETETALDRAIRRLPPALRTALTMQALGEMTSQEIGAALGLPAGTVRYRISQARRRLAEDLGLLADLAEKES